MNELPQRESTETTPPFIKYQEAFSSLFPGVIQDGTIDLHRLEEALGLNIEGLKDAKDRFGLIWAGKKKAVEALQSTSMAALQPDLNNSISWDKAENLFIQGDNLEVLKLLQNAYNDEIKLIYIDPPYNTGNDFVYNDDFADPLKHYLEVTGQVNADGNRLVSNTETSGRKHSNWLNMMYPRLTLARNLLTQDGVIFVSIDDNEVHHLRLMMNEIFGEENFISEFVWKSRTGGQDSKTFALQHEYILLYARDSNNFVPGRKIIAEGNYPLSDDVSKRRYKRQLLRKWGNNSKRSDRPNLFYPITAPDGTEVYPKLSPIEDGRWRWGLSRFKEEFESGNVEFIKDADNKWVAYERIWEPQDGEKTIPFQTVLEPDAAGITSTGTAEVKALFEGQIVFDYPKSTKLLTHIFELAGFKSGDTVLDFFAGSGTTGHATMLANSLDEGNRKFILVTLDEETDPKSNAKSLGYETVSEITVARLKKAMQIVPGAMDKGLRAFKLAASNFKETQSLEDGELELFSESLDKDFDADAIASEILLQLGISASEPWVKRDITGGSLIIAGGVYLVASKTLNSSLIDSILNERPSVLVFLEDAFASNDALKSNTYYTAKQLGIMMRTF